MVQKKHNFWWVGVGVGVVDDVGWGGGGGDVRVGWGVGGWWGGGGVGWGRGGMLHGGPLSPTAYILGVCCRIALRWMPQYPNDDKSPIV